MSFVITKFADIQIFEASRRHFIKEGDDEKWSCYFRPSFAFASPIFSSPPPLRQTPFKAAAPRAREGFLSLRRELNICRRRRRWIPDWRQEKASSRSHWTRERERLAHMTWVEGIPWGTFGGTTWSPRTPSNICPRDTSSILLSHLSSIFFSYFHSFSLSNFPLTSSFLLPPPPSSSNPHPFPCESWSYDPPFEEAPVSLLLV